jgi:hypothetical protein
VRSPTSAPPRRTTVPSPSISRGYTRDRRPKLAARRLRELWRD